jgi:DNA-binding transcriptional ArsR family regulator
MNQENKTVLDTAEIFKALGDSSRLKILKLIAAKGNTLCVGYIATHLGLSQPAVSQHLKLLKSVGILKGERQGYHVHYSINKDVLNPYGIDTIGFLESFGAEMDLANSCEYHNDEDSCAKLNR